MILDSVCKICGKAVDVPLRFKTLGTFKKEKYSVPYTNFNTIDVKCTCGYVNCIAYCSNRFEEIKGD